MDEKIQEEKEAPKLTLADLLSLPQEVFYSHIFPKLKYNDLLRLRRVCQPINLYANDFLQKNFPNQVQREINETNLTLQHFLQVNLPTTSIFINNSSPAFFEDPLIPSFLNLCGNQITHVKINHFGTFISEHELHFFSSLPNLLHLDISFIDASKRDCLSTVIKTVNRIRTRVPRHRPPFPPNFRNLKTLKLNEVQKSQKNDLGYCRDFINFCEKLDYVKHPLYKDIKASEWKGHMFGQLGLVMDYIEKRHRRNNPDQPNLLFYDLENYKIERNDEFGARLYWLVNLCVERNVKLVNVNSNLLSTQCMIDIGPIGRDPNSPLVSIKNVEWLTFLNELSNLEKLVVESTEDSGFAEGWREVRDVDTGEEQIEMPKWPNLKILDLKIDSRKMVGGGNVEEFLDFLFAPVPGKTRENVRELAVRYDLDKVFYKSIDNLPVPRVRDVTGMCPFVTKLTLGGWMGSDEQVTLFWEGLPLLEEVILEECVKIGDDAFVGAEKEDPVFLKLEHLRKFSLRKMDLMEKITEVAFDLVFRHLKVKEFCLTSDKPIKGITAAGIESLLTGDFNKYVERFPFDGWSLDGVSEEAFKELKFKFRATHMI